MKHSCFCWAVSALFVSSENSIEGRQELSVISPQSLGFISECASILFLHVVFSHRHKSPDKTRQNQLHSAHLTASLLLFKLEDKAAPVHSPPELESLIPPVSLLPFLSFGFCALIHGNLLTWLSSPRSTWHNESLATFLEFPENGAMFTFLCHFNQGADFFLPCHLIF